MSWWERQFEKALQGDISIGGDLSVTGDTSHTGQVEVGAFSNTGATDGILLNTNGNVSQSIDTVSNTAMFALYNPNGLLFNILLNGTITQLNAAGGNLNLQSTGTINALASTVFSGSTVTVNNDLTVSGEFDYGDYTSSTPTVSGANSLTIASSSISRSQYGYFNNNVIHWYGFGQFTSGTGGRSLLLTYPVLPVAALANLTTVGSGLRRVSGGSTRIGLIAFDNSTTIALEQADGGQFSGSTTYDFSWNCLYQVA